MIEEKFNVSLPAGYTWVIRFYLTAVDGQPIPIQPGLKVVWKLRDQLGRDWLTLASDDSQPRITVFDQAESGYQIEVPASVQAAARNSGLPATSFATDGTGIFYTHEAKAIEPSGVVTRQLHGDFEVEPSLFWNVQAPSLVT